jgi:hypothetical protein
MNETFSHVIAVFERRAIQTAERFLTADDALQSVAAIHEHHASVKQQSDVTKQSMFDALSDYEFVRRTTGM